MARKFKDWLEELNHVDSDHHVSCRDCGLILDKRYAACVTDNSNDREPQWYYCTTHKKKYDAISVCANGKKNYYLYVGFVPCNENGKIDKNSKDYQEYKMEEFLRDKGFEVVGEIE